MSGVVRFLAILAVSVGLSGCFISDKPLISPADATFPYQTIVYADPDGGEPQTLTRSDAGYLLKSDNSDEVATLLFKDVGDGLYVAQLSFVEDDEPRVLYSVLKVDLAAKKGLSYLAIAPDDWVDAPGLTKCRDNTVCIASLDDYVAHARAAIAKGLKPDADYNLVKLE